MTLGGINAVAVALEVATVAAPGPASNDAYRHRGTGHTVTLVGTVHVGEAGYYKRLHARVMGLEAAGAIVCQESVRPAAEGRMGDRQRPYPHLAGEPFWLAA